jgi:hypothetical protein
MSTLIDEVFFECKCNLGLDIGNANLSVLEIFYCGQLIKHAKKVYIWLVSNYVSKIQLGYKLSLVSAPWNALFFLLSIAVYHASFYLDFTIREYICLL